METKETQKDQNLQASTLRSRILEARDLKREPVNVKEWGVTVYVQELSSAAKTQLSSSNLQRNAEGDLILDEKNNPKVDRDALTSFQESLLIATLVDEEGTPIFNSEDVTRLAEKNAAVIERLHEAAANVNKTREKDVEALAKNS